MIKGITLLLLCYVAAISAGRPKNPEYWKKKYNMVEALGVVVGSFITGARNDTDTNRPSFSQQMLLFETNRRWRFHSLSSDAVLHYYKGEKLFIYQLDIESGSLTKHQLSPRNHAVYIKLGNWFVEVPAKPDIEGGYTLVGSTTIPSFAPAELKYANRKDLLKNYPQHKDTIILYTNE